MNDLPISFSNPPAKASAGRPSSNNDTPLADSQGFGNVLARQVADAAKPAESNPDSSADDANQTAGRDDTEIIPAPDSINTQPADMLAALLAQNNPTAIAQATGDSRPDVMASPDTGNKPDGNIQYFGNSQSAMSLPINTNSPMIPVMQVNPEMQVPEVQVTGKPATAPLAFTNGKPQAAPSPTAEFEIAAMPAKSAIEDSKTFAATFKTFDKNEFVPSSGNQTPRANVTGDLTASAPQAGSLPFLPAAATLSIQSSINTPITQAAWADDFSQKITWMATQHNQSAELHLNPPQLGPLDVVLKMNGDQASATFTSPHAAVREAIEQALPKLRDMLADSGIMLGNAMVSDQSAKNSQDNSPRKLQGRTPTSTSEGVSGIGSIQEARVSTISRHNGLVDTFA